MATKCVFRLSWLTLIPHLLLIVILIGIITVPIQILRILTTKIIIDKEMLYGERGILSKSIQNSPIKHIQSVRTDRSLFGRILGYGNVTITTAGDGYLYRGMANPERVRRVINGYM